MPYKVKNRLSDSINRLYIFEYIDKTVIKSGGNVIHKCTKYT